MRPRKYAKRYIKCSSCQKEFSPRDCPSDRKGRRGKFCSRECSSKSHIKLPREFVCPTCKKVFPNKYGKISVFCSRRCSTTKYKKGNIPWIKGLKGIGAGAKSHLWKGGITKLTDVFKTTLEYKTWRKAVFERDNYTCVWCGDNRGNNLQSDHIKPRWLIFKENNLTDIKSVIKCKELWDINNGRTLCKDCHKKTDTWGCKYYNENKFKTENIKLYS